MHAFKSPAIAILSTAVLISGALTACSKGDDVKTTEAPAAKDVNVPKNFPLPMYPDATQIPNTGEVSQGTTTVLLESKDSPDKVTAYYQDQLRLTGWNISNVMSMNTMST